MYLFYIDESGEITYNSGSKYFVFNAIGIHESNWKNINDKVNELKTAIFKSEDAPILEIKSNWLRFPKEREKRSYLKKLSKEELEQLSSGLFDIIINEDCVLISIVVDKNSLLKTYGIEKPEVNVFALQFLFEKISLYMDFNHKHEQAIIIMDKCSDTIEKSLNKMHVLKQTDGYSWKKIKNIIGNIMFVDSQYNNFIQLTDLCAYNINRAFKDDNPNYQFFMRILPKFAYSLNNGSINNVGITYKMKEYLQESTPNMYEFLNTYKNENSVSPNGKYTA